MRPLTRQELQSQGGAHLYIVTEDDTELVITKWRSQRLSKDGTELVIGKVEGFFHSLQQFLKRVAIILIATFLISFLPYIFIVSVRPLEQ